ncbi:heavy-metal-associated domain-containing protein [Gulosibacter sp. 10]|uniref:heavy-metal-associated domain-containing protein n=1 Tax=Gulosibacter sp. 10 TaxID=1255570 RepID=UPI00097F55AA|nr:heavy metal-associated domain-containing protein [Gulosibacter sp. 10]SJM63641.1 hypothetical protein FM112_09330 [Gulosibacter sp. 10]
MDDTALLVDGMTCVHCERAVTAELERLPQVEGVEADATSGRVRVLHSAPLNPAVVAEAIADAGYTLRSSAERPRG